MCFYLEWQLKVLNVDLSTLCDFEIHIHHDFAGPGPYPAVMLLQTAPAPFTLCATSFTTCVSLLKVINGHS
jgi:hypothetical protein